MSNNNGMENIVTKINKLQDLFCKVGESLDIERLKLPQIVVIGGQSVGKSSVLENIVGKHFIPRGNDIVTRCPLYLQLINDRKEYGEFLHMPGKIFVDYDEIQLEIEKQTEILAGKEGISAESITLKLHSSKVLDLTLVDLPGLVEVAVRNQNENIAQQIREVAIKYIQEENSLILAVSSATEDLANSVSLKLAAQVDPFKRRTIGIITKLDLVQDKDKLKRMIEILNNNFYPLKLGHIGVYNMSSDDLDNNKSIDEFLKEQEQFFKTSSFFESVVDRVGTQNLQKILNNELSNHIKQIVPSFRNMIHNKTRDATVELAMYGENETDGENDLLKLNKVLNKLHETFDKEIGRSGKVAMDWNNVSIGAKINNMLNKQYPDKIKAIAADPDILRKIAHLIMNHSGIHLSTFIPEESFHATIIKLTEKYLPISLEVVEAISKEMQSLIDYCNDELKIYPRLRDTIDFEMKSHIRKVTNVTKEKITEMIEIECSYINTEHKDFSQMKDDLKTSNPQISVNNQQTSVNNPQMSKSEGKPEQSNTEIFQKPMKNKSILFKVNQTNTPTETLTEPTDSIIVKNDATDVAQQSSAIENEDSNKLGYTTDMSQMVSQMESSLTTQLLHKMSMAYITIIVTTLIDYIPKLVMHSMVRSTQNFLKIELLVNIQKDCDITDLLSRSKDEQIQIEQLCDKINICKEALTILNNI